MDLCKGSIFQNNVKFLVYLVLIIATMIWGVGTAAPVRILIVYYSQNGHTEQLAHAIAEGAQQIANVEVKIQRVQEVQIQDTIAADAIILGTPVYNANVAPKMQEYINNWPLRNNPMRNKLGAVFVTGAGISAGQESTELSLLRSMMIFGMIVVGGEKWTSPFGVAAITGEAPFNDTSIHEQFLLKGRELGGRVAKLAVRMHNSNSAEHLM